MRRFEAREDRANWGGTRRDDNMQGHAGSNHFFGGVGHDLMDGDDGDDLLRGGVGQDTVIGGAGDDDLRGDDGNDVFREWGDSGDDEINGGRGRDTVSYDDNTGEFALQFNLNGNTAHQNGNSDELRGIERIVATDSDDDLLDASGISRNLNIHLGSGAVSGRGGQQFVGFEHALGGEGRNVMHGNAGANFMTSGDSGDHLHGAAGDDTLAGNEGNDKLHGGAYNDFLFADEGHDTVFGDAGDDTILALAESTDARGGLGNDTYVTAEGGLEIRDAGGDTDSLVVGDVASWLDGFNAKLAELTPHLVEDESEDDEAEEEEEVDEEEGTPPDEDPSEEEDSEVITPGFEAVDGNNDGFVDALLIDLGNEENALLIHNYFDNTAEEGAGTGLIETITLFGTSYTFDDVVASFAPPPEDEEELPEDDGLTDDSQDDLGGDDLGGDMDPVF